VPTSVPGDGAVEDRVRRLLGAEPLEAAAHGDPIASTMSDAGVVDDPIARTFRLWIRSDSADSVSSMSVAGSSRWIRYRSMWSVCRRRSDE